MKTDAEIRDAIRAQEELCRARALPMYAPRDGVCWARGCRRQIYELLDGRSYVTGCPHCARSYCD